MSQIKPLKLLPNGDFSQVDVVSDDLTMNSFTGNVVTISGGTTGEKLIVKANASDAEQKIFNVKNSSDVSVAFIDEDGDMTVNNLTVNGVETVVGTMNAQSNLLLTGDFSVSGNVTLGNNSSDNISFLGRASTNIDLNSFKVINSSLPTASGDLANKSYVDGEVSTLRAASMLLNGTQAMTANMSLGGFKITSLGTPTASGDASNKSYVDSEISTLRTASVLRDGTQAMTGNLNLGGFKITSLGAPTLSGDAVNKSYVDSQVASVTQVEDISLSFAASGDVAAGAPVFVVSTADDTVAEADASSIGTSILMGLSESSITNGSSGKVTVVGFAVISSSLIDDGAFTKGKPVYLSENKGKLTSTPPTTVGARIYQVGVATSSTKLVINLKQGITIT